GRLPKGFAKQSSKLRAQHLRPRDVDVESHIEIALVSFRAIVDRKRHQPADRLARTGRTVGIDHRDRIDEPVVTESVAAQAIALNLYLRAFRSVATPGACHVCAVESRAAPVEAEDGRANDRLSDMVHGAQIEGDGRTLLLDLRDQVLGSHEWRVWRHGVTS